jgi:two-component sensor histidine kinase
MSCNCQRPVREHADIPVPVALHELRHRYANELAATLASLQIARARGDGDRLIEEAIDRIEAQAKLARFLIEPHGPRFQVVDGVLNIGALLIRSRHSGPAVHIRVKTARVSLDTEQTAEFLPVINELLVNALKHVREGIIHVAVKERGNRLILTVRNNAENPTSPTAGGGQGVAILRRYLRHKRASLTVRVRDGKYSAVVAWPLCARDENRH